MLQPEQVREIATLPIGCSDGRPHLLQPEQVREPGAMHAQEHVCPSYLLHRLPQRRVEGRHHQLHVVVLPSCAIIYESSEGFVGGRNATTGCTAAGRAWDFSTRATGAEGESGNDTPTNRRSPICTMNAEFVSLAGRHACQQIDSGIHLMKAMISSSLRTARPSPSGREASVTRGRAPPECQRDVARPGLQPCARESEAREVLHASEPSRPPFGT